jgi:hypothetical protein
MYVQYVVTIITPCLALVRWVKTSQMRTKKNTHLDESTVVKIKRKMRNMLVSKKMSVRHIWNENNQIPRPKILHMEECALLSINYRKYEYELAFMMVATSVTTRNTLPNLSWYLVSGKKVIVLVRWHCYFQRKVRTYSARKKFFSQKKTEFPPETDEPEGGS